MLEVGTEAGLLLRELLEPVWAPLREAGLPISDPPLLRHVVGARFVQGEKGPERAQATITVSTQDSKDMVGNVLLAVCPDNTAIVRMEDMSIGDAHPDDLEIRVDYPAGSQAGYDEDLIALRKLI